MLRWREFEQMANHWPTQPLEALVEDDSPITYGVVKPGEHDPSGVLFIRGGDIADCRVMVSQLRTITHSVSEQYRRTLLRGGELVVSLVGNPGQVALVPESLAGANIARQVGLVRLGGSVEPRFVMYFLASRHGQIALGAHSIGSVQQVINLRDLKTVEVPVPPLDEQRAIAETLGSLDDKIELNRRMNRTLEQMAAAIFKAWFVDFEPVKAKAAGATRFPTMPQPVFDALPTEFTDSPLGPIPKGWDVRKLDNLLELSYGKALKADNRIAGPVPVFGSNGIVGWHDEHLVKGPGIVVGRKGNPGTVVWADRDFFPIDTTFYVSPTGIVTSTHYLFHMLMGLDLPALSADSAVPGLNRNMAYMSDVLVPSPMLADAFEQLASHFSGLITSNNDQAKTLADIRDALLPKLLSGEIRVGAAEKLVGDALARAAHDAGAGASARDGGGLAATPELVAVVKPPTADRRPSNNAASAAALATNKARATRRANAAAADDQPPAIDAVETDKVMAEYRQAIRSLGRADRETLLREVARGLGYRRLGSVIRERLKGHLRAAIRRDIIAADGADEVLAATSSMADYSAVALLDVVRAVMRGQRERPWDEVVADVAHYLGFERVRATVRQPVDAAIDAAVRRGELGYDGRLIWWEAG
jgi:type I restriction enzyme S subunit